MLTVENLVREARIEKDISQSYLAKRIGVHKQMVSNFEREECRIPLKYFSAIAKVLGMDIKLMIEIRIANMSSETRQFFA